MATESGHPRLPGRALGGSHGHSLLGAERWGLCDQSLGLSREALAESLDLCLSAGLFQLLSPLWPYLRMTSMIHRVCRVISTGIINKIECIVILA